MISILILLLVVALVVGLIWWVCDYMTVPQPLNKFVKMVSMVIGCIIVILALLNLLGYNTGVPIR